MTKSDETLLQNVIDELAFDPAIESKQIGVTVDGGVVTLRGTVGSYAEVLTAEEAAKRVSGVRAFTDELVVDMPSLHHRDDRDIAKAVADSLGWDITVPDESIQVKVDKGWVTLEGAADWQFEIDNAERAIQYLTGVRGVTNLIALRLRVAAGDVKAKLVQTFERSAEIDAGRIIVEVEEGSVTLRGTVHSWNEHDDATRAAFSLPGVRHVRNLTHVG
jgi:osmotically-inducible protein OsmY